MQRNERELENIGDEENYLLTEGEQTGGLSGVHGPRYFQFDAAKVLTHDDVINLYGSSATQFLPYAGIEFEFEENTSLEPIHAIPDDVEAGYLVDSDFIHPDKIKQKNKVFTSFSKK